MPLWDGGYTYSSGGGDEVVVGTCQARKARKELLVVFVQEVMWMFCPVKFLSLESLL